MTILHPTGREKFAALSPSTPLPWNVHPDYPWRIIDASGAMVCDVVPSDYLGIVGMILVAVNTLGGFKAETQ